MTWHDFLLELKRRVHLAPQRLEPAPWLRHAAPFTAAVLITCVFIAGMQLPLIVRDHRVLLLVILALLGAGIVAGAAWSVGYAWRAMPSLVILTLGGFGFLLTLSSDASRYGLALAVATLCYYALSFMEQGGKEGMNGDERQTIILLAPATIFTYAFCFAMLEFTTVNVVWMALLAGLVSAAVVGEIVWRISRPSSSDWRLSAFAFIVGAEMLATLSFLPLKHLVNGTVLAILLSLYVHKVRDSLVPAVDQLAFRRHVALSVLLIAVIMVTAQWL